MAISRCPGQDSRYWDSDVVFDAPCPNCGEIIEFWKDQPKLRCSKCGKKVLNPKLDTGCAKWCKFAVDCFGLDPTGQTDESFCQALIQKMTEVFGDDRKRIEHALEVLGYAETILQAGHADPLVVRAAAVLHDIGIKEAETKHGSSAGKYQEIEGPPIARAILDKFDVSDSQVEHICRIVGSHHSAGDIDSPEFDIIWDADRLANIPDECSDKNRQQLEDHVATMLRTATGKTLATGKLLGEKSKPTDEA